MNVLQCLFWLCFAAASCGWAIGIYSNWRESRQKPKEPERWYEGEEVVRGHKK